MLDKLGKSDRLLILKKPFDSVEVMQLAGTLTEKSRSGARDINKFYGPGGPNYLKAAR